MVHLREVDVLVATYAPLPAPPLGPWVRLLSAAAPQCQGVDDELQRLSDFLGL